jgi:hypothetical protein
LENLKGRPKHQLGDKSRKDLRDIGWEFVDWIYLAVERDERRAVVNTVIKLWVP